MKKLVWIIIILVVLGLIAWVVQKSAGPSTPVSTEPIKIGVSTILSGDFAAAGENMVNAAKLAAEEINNSGGINGRKIELTVEDAGWDSKTGLAAAQKLINADGIKYIVGGTSSNGTLASAPLANENKVIYMTPVTGGTNVDNAGEYVFRTANSDLLAGRDVADAMNKLGYKKVGVIAEVTEYTLDFKKSFEKRISELDSNLVFAEEFQPGTTDFRTLVAKVKAAKPEAVLIASQTGVGGAYFIKQAREAGLKATYFSDFTFVVNENAKKIVGSFEGVYFADPAYDTAKTKSFLDLYQKTYNKPSLIPFHAAATYDDVMLLAKAMKAVGDDSQKVHDWLLGNVKNYRGLMGTYSLDKNGNSDLGFVIKVVKNGEFIPINN